MKKTILLPFFATILSAMATSGDALAQANSIKLGWADIDPRSSAGTVTGPYTIPGALSARVKPKSTLFLSLARAIDNHLELELALGVPPEHDAALVVLRPTDVPPIVAAQDGVTIAKLTQIAPTLFLNYRFGDANSTFRPFVGLGLNYTRFTDAKSTPINDALNGGPTQVRLANSTGPAAQIGVSANLGGAWYLMAAWSTAKVKTVITTNTLDMERTLDVKFKPSVLVLAVGYRF